LQEAVCVARLFHLLPAVSLIAHPLQAHECGLDALAAAVAASPAALQRVATLLPTAPLPALLSRAKALLRDIGAVRAALAAAIAPALQQQQQQHTPRGGSAPSPPPNPLAALDAAISSARELPYSGPDLTAAEARRAAVAAALSAAEAAAASLDSTAIREALAAAAALGIELPDAAALRRFQSLPPRQRLGAALRRAVEAGDVDRVARCTIDLKRLFLAESPSSWALSTFAGLRDGVKREADAALAYSPVPLTASLTRLEPPLAAAAVAVSRSLLAFTGDLQVRRRYYQHEHGWRE
jgi:hypothetical protein